MKLENQVCSLESSKRLKQLRAKQESLWWWIDINDTKVFENIHKPYIASSKKSCFSTKKEENNYIQDNYIYSAFTVAELGEMLKENDQAINLTWWVNKKDDKWFIVRKGKIVEADTEANARAEMLIWLIENKLLNLTKGDR